MSDEMDPIKKDKIVTFTVIGLVCLDMVAMAVLVGLNATGGITMETMLYVSTILSVLMFAIIAVYMLYSYRSKPKLMEYKKMRDSMESEEKGYFKEESSEGDESKNS